MGFPAVPHSRFVPSSLSWYASALGAKAFPLDMSQYGHLFNSTRIPHRGKDELVSFDHTNGHIVVMRKGRFYRVNVVQEDGWFTLIMVSPAPGHA